MNRFVKTAVLGMFMAALGGGWAGCAGDKANKQTGYENMAEEPIEKVLKKHAGSLMKLEGVVGIGEGLCEGKPCIKVFLTRKTPELEKKIPASLDGYPVILEETGAFKALPEK
jgi:hypothetical protein